MLVLSWICRKRIKRDWALVFTNLVSDVRFIYPDSDFELYDAFHGGLLLYLFMMVGILIWDPKPKGPVQGVF